MSSWIPNGFVPQNLNTITDEPSSFMIHLWYSWMNLNCKSPAGCAGHVKVYANMKTPLSLSPVLPVFQLTFALEIVTPFVSASSVGLPEIVGDFPSI